MPIREDMLAQHVARAHGFNKTGEKIRNIVFHILKSNYYLQQERGHHFVWMDKASSENWFKARVSINKRNLDEIP